MAMLRVPSLRDSRFLKTARANARPQGTMLGMCGMTISQDREIARANARPKGAVHGGTA